MIKLLDEIPIDKLPSIIQDPFGKNKIISIQINAYKSFFDGTFNFYSLIEFKNGNTEGKQKIVGTSMDDVYLKTANFVKSLE